MKRRKIEETEINETLDNMSKPTARSGDSFPLNDLPSGRIFEILLYQIFKGKIENGEFPNKFDKIDLMQGSGEQGRDCVLTFNGKNVGVIQCKKWQKRLNESEAVPEIIKFVLNFLEDKTLIDDINNFTYYFAVSTGFTGETTSYLTDFNNRILQEPNLAKWTNEVIKKYETLHHLKYAAIENDLKNVLASLHIEKIIPEDLDLWIENSASITRRFFEVKLVVDIDFAEKKFQEFLNALQPGGDADIAYSIQRLIEHSKLILSTIFDTIHWTTHINHSRIIHEIWDFIETYKVVLVTGDPGVGKSALLKNFFSILPNDTPFFAFKAEDFNVPHIDKVFNNIGLRVSFLQLNAHLPSKPCKIVFVDGIEKLLEISQDAFIQFLQIISDDPSWRLIATCRTYAVEELRQSFFFQENVTPIIYRILPFSDNELRTVTQKVPALVPLLENSRLKKLLSIPFYLHQICKIHWENAEQIYDLTEKTLEQALWKSVIEKGSDDRRRCFIDIAVRRAKKMHLFVSSGTWSDNILKALVDDEVLKKRLEPRGYAPAHDVFEDWALTRFIDETFEEFEESPTDFFEAIGHEPAMRRSFRLWLAKRIDEPAYSCISLFITNVLRDEMLAQYWKDEVITAVLLSQNSEHYFTHQPQELLKDEGTLLKRIIRILRTACWEPDEYLLKFTGTLLKDEKNILSTVLLTPSGSGWSNVIKFVYHHLDKINSEDWVMISGLLRDWSQGIKDGRPLPEGAREAGLLALHLLEIPRERYNPQLQTELCRVVVKVAQVLRSEISNLVDQYLEDPERHRTHYFTEFIQRVLDFPDGTAMCQYLPETVVKIALQTWLLPHERVDNEYHTDIEYHFDLAHHASHYFPASGTQGPFASLLHFHPQIALRLILTLCNHAIEGYINSSLIEMRPPQISDPRFKNLISSFNEEDHLVQVTIILNDHQTITQWGNPRLWRLYRGTSVGPDVLQSALMALENWLLRQLEAKQDVFAIFEKLLEESNSVAITAVLVSVATAYPHAFGEQVLPLFRTREFFRWDLQRYMHETEVEQLLKIHFTGTSFSPAKEIHNTERQRSKNYEHRKFHLENLVLKLQFTSLRESISNIIDDFKNALPIPEEQGEEEKTWRIILKRMDLREYQFQIDKTQPKIQLIQTEPEKDIQEFQEQDRPKIEKHWRFVNLLTWGRMKFTNERSSQEIYSNWQEALAEAQELSAYLQDNSNNEDARLHAGGPVYVAAVCLRDYCNELTDEQKGWCAEQIIEAVGVEMNSFFDDLVRVSAFEFAGSRPAAMVLPLLLPLCEEDEERQIVRYCIAGSLLHPSREVRHFAIRGVHQYLWNACPDFAKVCLKGMIEYAALSEQFFHVSFEKDFQEYAEQKIQDIHQLRQRIASLQTNELSYIEQISFETHQKDELIFALEMVPFEVHDEAYYKLFKRILNEFIQTNLEPEFRHERDYELQHSFADLFARFTLCQPPEKALDLCQPLLEVLETCPELSSEILSSFVYMEDHLQTLASIETFWAIWEMFAGNVFQSPLLSSQYNYTTKHVGLYKIIRTLLLVEIEWKKEATEWKPLKARPDFVQRTCHEIGHYPVVFGSIVQLFTTIGQNLLPEGLLWLQEAFSRGDQKDLLMVPNTISYLEILLRKSLFSFGTEIRKQALLRKAVMDLLDALVNAGSYVAYQLRERLIAPMPS
jgi:energy-coupling factor transporter ATP-binding protein EcfA2